MMSERERRDLVAKGDRVRRPGETIDAWIRRLDRDHPTTGTPQQRRQAQALAAFRDGRFAGPVLPSAKRAPSRLSTAAGRRRGPGLPLGPAPLALRGWA